MASAVNLHSASPWAMGPNSSLTGSLASTPKGRTTRSCWWRAMWERRHERPLARLEGPIYPVPARLPGRGGGNEHPSCLLVLAPNPLGKPRYLRNRLYEPPPAGGRRREHTGDRRHVEHLQSAGEISCLNTCA